MIEALHQYLNEKRGRQTELAAALNIASSAISQWEKVPAERIGEVSRVTGIPLERLRPDLFAAAAGEAAQ